MSQLLTIKINLDRIAERDCYKGRKGLYLDAIAIPTPDSKYGQDFMVVQSIDKVRREQGEKGAILGNASWLKTEKEREPEPEPKQAEARTKNENEEDIPF